MDTSTLQTPSGLPQTQPWRPMMKLQLYGGTAFFGPGCRRLLELVRVTGSVRLASQQMQLSYSKAWKILRSLESQLGFQAVYRQQGGALGGASSLTPQGEELLRRFTVFQQECEAVVEDIFYKHFPGQENL